MARRSWRRFWRLRRRWWCRSCFWWTLSWSWNCCCGSTENEWQYKCFKTCCWSAYQSRSWWWRTWYRWHLSFSSLQLSYLPFFYEINTLFLSHYFPYLSYIFCFVNWIKLWKCCCFCKQTYLKSILFYGYDFYYCKQHSDFYVDEIVIIKVLSNKFFCETTLLALMR